MDKGDVGQILKYCNDMKPRVEELESKFGDDPAVARFLAGIKKQLEEATEVSGCDVRFFNWT